MRNLALLAAAGSMAIFAAPVQAAEMPVAPASATTIFTGFHNGASPVTAVADYDRDRWDDRRDRRNYRDRDRNRGRDYNNGRRLSRNDRVWRGDDGRYYCKRDNGTTGLVIGAVGGALLGRTVDTRGDRTVGTVLGGLAGGLLGREVDRGDARCR